MEKIPAVLTVSFSGHRAIADDASAKVGEAVARTFRMLRGVADTLQCPQSALGVCDLAPARIRLLTGLAGGADTMAFDFRKELGDHLLHLVFPYLSSDGAPLTDREVTAGGTPPRSIPDDASVTVLDGLQAEVRKPYRDGHMEQCRWIVQHADVMVVVWNGDNAAGVGGTADSVELAVRRRLPIIWIDPEDPEKIRLIDGNALWENMAVREITSAISTDHVSEVSDLLDSEALSRIICSRLRPAWLLEEPHEMASGHRPSAMDGFLRWIGLKAPRLGRHSHEPLLTEREALDAYIRLYNKHSKPRGKLISWVYKFQVGRWSRPFQLLGLFWLGAADKLFREEANAPPGTNPPEAIVPRELASELKDADRFANGVSSQHRSEQIVLLYLATLAVLVGVLPSAGSIPYLDSHLTKPICVGIEACLLGVMFWIWYVARRMRRHRIWSDSRRYAERLRVLQSTWPFGFDVNDLHVGAPGTWTEWRTQELIRSLGPPTGVMNAEHLRQVSEHGWNSIIKSQIGYHKRNASLMHGIHRRFEKTESFLFFTLVVCLLAFLSVGIATHTFTDDHGEAVPHEVAVEDGHGTVADNHAQAMEGHSATPGEETHETASVGEAHGHGLPHWVGEILLLMSAVFPAIGACIIALTAQLDILSSGNKSSRLLDRFEELDGQMNDAIRAYETPGENGSLLRARELVRDAARLALSDADAWQIELDRRRIIRGP